MPGVRDDALDVPGLIEDLDHRRLGAGPEGGHEIAMRGGALPEAGVAVSATAVRARQMRARRIPERICARERSELLENDAGAGLSPGPLRPSRL